VDFEAIANSKMPGAADRLLLKMGAAMNSETTYPSPNPENSISVELDAVEARQISDALEGLERLQVCPQDVMEMSRALRARLIAAGRTGC
jgi:hypothetical protein